MSPIRIAPGRWRYACLVALAMAGLGACRTDQDQPAATTDHGAAPAAAVESEDELVLVFPYGSEKQAWLTEATQAFHAAGLRASDGRRIRVDARPMGSGEMISEVLSGRLQAHLISPASAAFITLGNAESRAKTGQDLVARTDNLLLSPVVIAMWRPMAEAIGWGKEPVGWSDIIKLAGDPEGWASHGFPQWGRFRFGHTHPEYSNSGLISLLAETYAGAGKVAGLTLADVARPEVGETLRQIEQSVVHYGSSTGFFAKSMFGNGPGYLSAAVLYENNIIESYDGETKLPFPVVAIYPKEGTFWADHPVGVVQQPWVDEAHRAAAQQYIDFLLDRPQQERALAFGFRPADVAIPLGAPIDAAHGVDPAEPKTTLEVPSADVMQAVIDLWRKNKKHAHVALVLDTSGSMGDDDKLTKAQAGVQQLVTLLDDDDLLSLLPFSGQPAWAIQSARLGDHRDEVEGLVSSLFADGDTALYDAVGEAQRFLQDSGDRDRIAAVVVLSDGEDTASALQLEALSESLRRAGEGGGIRIFTIAYGDDANTEVLSSIAETTRGRFYTGTPENIREVLLEIATFF